MVLCCLWSFNKRHCAHIQEVRAEIGTEIKYMCTTDLGPAETNCSSDNPHGKQYMVTSQVWTTSFFCFQKSLTISGLLHRSRYRAGWLLTTRQWWATTLPWGLSSRALIPPAPVLQIHPDKGWGGLPSPKWCPANPGTDSGEVVFEQWQVNCTCCSRGPGQHLRKMGFSRRTSKRRFHHRRK